MPPLRPKPDDFRARFIALGWSGIEQHYVTSCRVVRRWIDEEGRDSLIAERAAYVARLQERDRAFRRRAAMLGTTAGLPDDVARRLSAEARAVKLGTGKLDHQQQRRMLDA